MSISTLSATKPLNTKFKVAHLLLVHHAPLQVYKLAKALEHPCADIYIHVDNDTDISPFIQILATVSNCHFINNRHNVHWGGYSVVKATLHSFTEILNSNNNYAFINLLSGADYPTQPASSFYEYIAQYQAKSFFEFEIEGSEWWNTAKSRFKQYHFPDSRIRGTYLFERLLNLVVNNRKVPNGLTIVGRSQWFTIATLHANYVLNYVKENPEVQRFFKYTWGPDELFFQTILLNSPYRHDIINDNLRYIDWSDGLSSPKILRDDDFYQIKKAKKWFARKFDLTLSATLQKRIDNELLIESDIVGE